jgi:hypothetical protein
MNKVPAVLVSLCIPACLTLCQPRPGAGLENGAPKGYVCTRASGPINVDGQLSEAAWKRARWTNDFTDIEGNLKPAPRFRTRVKMLWDDHALYIGAMLEEPHVWATLTRRDTVIFYDNDFEVFIDPDGDNHEYYELEMNALNTVWDLFLPLPYRDSGKAVDGWDIAGLRTAVHIDGTLNDPRDTDRGWSVEIALPWRALGEYAHRPVPPREGDQWRINFSRVEWDVEMLHGGYQKVKGHPENNWVWSPQWVIDMHRPELWGFVQFTKKVSGRTWFVRDPSLPARTLLMSVYYAQTEYRKKYGHWAERLEETTLGKDCIGKLRFLRTENGWTAEVTDHDQQWRVSQNSKLERIVP